MTLLENLKIKYVYQNEIILLQTLSDSFVSEFDDRKNWEYISRYKIFNLSKHFMDKLI